MNSILHINGLPVTIENIERSGNEIRFTIAGQHYHFIGQVHKDGSFSLDREIAAGEWQRHNGTRWLSTSTTHRIQLEGIEATVSEQQKAATNATSTAPLSPVAPMPGLVRSVLVKKGERVSEGQALVVLEAMKLQLTLSAGGDAVVTDVLVRVGQLVPEGMELITLTAKKK